MPDRKSWSNLFRVILKKTQKPIIIIIWILLAFLIFPLIVAYNIGENLIGKLAVLIVLQIILLFLAELIFGFAYFICTGSHYQKDSKIPFEKIYVKPHPYIPFIMKSKFLTEKKGLINYPLHKGKIYSSQFTTNNLGFINGEKGDRDIITPKPRGLYRINCIGASTTGNYLEFNRKTYSYPLELEKILKSSLPISLEVNNCGQGGYNSADIMVRFILQLLDTKPDMVILYHGYNDIRAYLTSEFKSDYSHTRKNLGENYWKFYLASKIPNFKLNFIDYLTNNLLGGNVRNSLLDHVNRGDLNQTINPNRGLETYKRNIQCIIDICKCNNIQIILSTYCHFLYEDIKDDDLHLLYKSIVKMENDIIRALAKENELELVDNANLVPNDEKYFVDSIHFTAAGMQYIARNIANKVISIIK